MLKAATVKAKVLEFGEITPTGYQEVIYRDIKTLQPYIFRLKRDDLIRLGAKEGDIVSLQIISPVSDDANYAVNNAINFVVRIGIVHEIQDYENIYIEGWSPEIYGQLAISVGAVNELHPKVGDLVRIIISKEMA